MRQLFKHSILWLIGGLIYILIEMLWRGRTHWTMFILGGICFVGIGLINELRSWQMPLYQQTLISAVLITVMEFITGCTVNLLLKWEVWDYSNIPFNILGQICVLFMLLWIILSVVAIILDDWLRYWLFGEQRPVYKLF